MEIGRGKIVGVMKSFLGNVGLDGLRLLLRDFWEGGWVLDLGVDRW